EVDHEPGEHQDREHEHHDERQRLAGRAGERAQAAAGDVWIRAWMWVLRLGGRHVTASLERLRARCRPSSGPTPGGYAFVPLHRRAPRTAPSPELGEA